MRRCADAFGFSLTEFMVSVVVFTVGILGLASAVSVASMQLQLGARDTRIALLSADQMERLKARGYDQATSGERVEGDYHLVWTVAGDSPRQVTLIATYPKMMGGERSDTLIAYLTP